MTSPTTAAGGDAAAAPAHAAAGEATPLPGFAHSRAQFRQIVDDALAAARARGASDAVAEVSEGVGLDVSVRKGALENVERNRDRSLGVTVYVGGRRGNASTSDFSAAAIARTVEAAHDIARFTAEDPAAGLPDEADLASADEAARDLGLFHPWALDADEGAALARRVEDAAFAVDRRITNSEGASVSAQQSHFWMGNSRGFRGGWASSRHALSVAPIATNAASGDMQRDAWSTSMRDPMALAAPEDVGRYAAERALARLDARRLRTARVPVLFESQLASGLLGSFVGAISGGALYRRTSFLTDSLGRAVLAEHLDVDEDPFERAGKASAPFDDEGVRVRARRVVDAGVVRGWFLGSYSARKLGMTTTGHAGGAHNLRLTSRRTRPGDHLPAMIAKLHRGLFVTELMGQGVNGVTGDYSRGAAGYWVERGRISHPVHELTIAGNLKSMLREIAAVGADAPASGTRRCGSMIVEGMKVAGT